MSRWRCGGPGGPAPCRPARPSKSTGAGAAGPARRRSAGTPSRRTCVVRSRARRVRSRRRLEWPSPPSWTGRSLPGSRLSATASPGWMSAQCAAMWSRRVSAVIRACSLASAAARVPAASSSASSFFEHLFNIKKGPTLHREFGVPRHTDNTSSIRTTPQQS